jgi:hypothetical protein
VTTTESIFERRIARLERRNRIYQALLLAAAAIGLMAVTTNDGTLRARSFELVSEDGSIRASLGLHEGNPVFMLNDENGVERLKLFYEPDATGIYVLDEESTPRIGIAQFSHGGGGVALHGPQSKGAAVLYLRETGSLRFFDTDGEVTTQVPSPIEAVD